MNFFHMASKTLSIREGWRSLFDTSTSPPLALELAVLNTKYVTFGGILCFNYVEIRMI
jgi:hypothetical protein